MKVIFVHGSGGYRGVWRYQTDHFPDSDAVDLPGHLHGQALDSAEEYADWLDEYIRCHGYVDVVVVGHSFGGAIALTYALKCPDRLKAVVIIGSGARLRVHHAFLTTLERAIEGDLSRWHRLVEEMHRLTSEEYKSEIVERQKAIGPAVMLSDFLCCDKFDVMDSVQDIGVPALIICGEHDTMTPAKYAHYLGSRIPNSRVTIIPEGTHYVYAERPDAVDKAIADFLQTLPS